MEDGGGAEYKIALNSGIEFGILYNPNDKRDEAVVGVVFQLCLLLCRAVIAFSSLSSTHISLIL